MKWIIAFFKKLFSKKSEDTVEKSVEYKCVNTYACKFLSLGERYQCFVINDGKALEVIDDSGSTNVYSIERFELC